MVDDAPSLRQVVRWIAYDRVGGATDIGDWGGSIEKGMRWADFLADVDPAHMDHYEALRRAVVMRGLRRGGDWHQNAADGVPMFDDGAVATFSMRGWGDLLAAIWSTEDGRDYGYMDFYLDSCVVEAGLRLEPPEP